MLEVFLIVEGEPSENGATIRIPFLSRIRAIRYGGRTPPPNRTESFPIVPIVPIVRIVPIVPVPPGDRIGAVFDDSAMI